MTGLATTPASGGPTRVGRLLLAMALLLALVFGGIAWLQAQSLRLLSAKVVYQGDNVYVNGERAFGPEHKIEPKEQPRGAWRRSNS